MDTWKSIPEFIGYFINAKGDIYKDDGSLIKRKFLKSTLTNRGYVVVNLYRDNKKERHYIHRLLAQTFIPNPENKPQVNHINGIKNDNNLDNLEWATSSEDRLHAVKNGLTNNQFKVIIVNKKTLYIESFNSQREASLSMKQHINYIADSKRRNHPMENNNYKWKIIQWAKHE